MLGLADGGVVVLVGTRDADLSPAITRGWGLRLAPDGSEARICVADATSADTLANIADNQQIAVTFSKPSTYRTFQLKGRVLEVTAASPDAMADVVRHREAFVQEVGTVGLPRELAERVFSVEIEVSPAVKALRFRVDAVFDQTPGPAAGGRL